MNTIILCALICSACTLYLIAPVAATHKRVCYLLICLLPCLALGIHLMIGSSGLPSQPAMFDTDPARIDARRAVTEELEAMRDLSVDPENVTLMMRLAGIRIGQGKFDEAITLLESGAEKFPDNQDIKLQLGAAYFAKGLLLAETGQKEQSVQTLQKALEKTPENAPFLDVLKKILEKISQDTNTP